MHLTDHLSDVQLNEYLDHEGEVPVPVEAHLSACADCAARLAALQALFDEIASLPETRLSRDLAAPVVRRVSGRVLLPRSLRLTVTLQFVAAIVTLVLAAPFIMQFLSPYLSSLQVPSLVSLFLQIQVQWTAWFEILARLQLPGIPEIPVLELSSVFVILTIVGVSILWLVGNGLLLRNSIDPSREARG